MSKIKIRRRRKYERTENPKKIFKQMTIWKNGLKVILESVHTHSKAQRGDRDYLKFVLRYVV